MFYACRLLSSCLFRRGLFCVVLVCCVPYEVSLYNVQNKDDITTRLHSTPFMMKGVQKLA